jgi:SSS family solute:Na+ symporter
MVMIAVSLTTPEPSYQRLAGLTYATVSHGDRERSRGSWDWREVIGSAIVLAGIVGAYLYFNG